MDNRIRAMWQRLPAPDGRTMAKNLRHNWYFPLSAAAFFYPQVQWLIDPSIWHISLLCAFLAMFAVATQCAALWQPWRRLSWPLRLYALLSTLGVCLRSQRYTYETLLAQPRFYSLADPETAARLASMVLTVCGGVFVLAAMAFFWERLRTIFREIGILATLKGWEWALYGVLALGMLFCMGRIFLATSAFYTYSTGGYDVIYTSDSGALVYNMGYLFLSFPENDLRQPLFAVFAAPFVGAPYAIAEVLRLSPAWQAILVNGVQVLLLVLGNLLLTRLLKLTPGKRACLMLVASVSYTQMLFLLMMEQYVIAYFWLMCALALVVSGHTTPRLALWGAGNTLLTSLFWTPCYSSHSPFRQFGAWLRDMVWRIVEFIALLLAFGRFDVLYTLTDKIVSLSKFSGGSVPLWERLCQYTVFVRNLFFTPAAAAGMNTTTPQAHISWMLEPVSGISFAGVVIIMLALVSAVWNRRQRAARFAFYWIVFSLLLLVVLGWGTKENGLILYALYFGWAFLVLLFLLVQKLARTLHTPWLLPLICTIAAVVLAANGIRGIWAMVQFGMTYFPN